MGVLRTWGDYSQEESQAHGSRENHALSGNRQPDPGAWGRSASGHRVDVPKQRERVTDAGRRPCVVSTGTASGQSPHGSLLCGHLRIVPRLATAAGFELGSGMAVNSTFSPMGTRMIPMVDVKAMVGRVFVLLTLIDIVAILRAPRVRPPAS